MGKGLEKGFAGRVEPLVRVLNVRPSQIPEFLKKTDRKVDEADPVRGLAMSILPSLPRCIE